MSEIAHASGSEAESSGLIETALYGIPDESTAILSYLHESRSVIEIDLGETVYPRAGVIIISPYNMARGDVNVAYWTISGRPTRSPGERIEPFESELFRLRGPYSTNYSLRTRDRAPTDQEVALTTEGLQLLRAYPIHDELPRRRQSMIGRLMAGFLRHEA